jgi:hypothetical protein
VRKTTKTGSQAAREYINIMKRLIPQRVVAFVDAKTGKLLENSVEGPAPIEVGTNRAKDTLKPSLRPDSQRVPTAGCSLLLAGKLGIDRCKVLPQM